MPKKKVKVALMNYDCAHYTENYNQYPILFVHDEKDAVINVRRIKEFAEKVPSSQLFIGNHGGHFKHYKHPEVIKAIWLFVNAN